MNGTIHLSEAAAAQAQLDLTTAYNDAAGRTVGAVAVAGNLGGQTLFPGLYTPTSSIEITSGDLTLDASRREATVLSHHLPLTVLRPIALSYRPHTNKVLGRFQGGLHSVIGGEGGAQTARWVWPRKPAHHIGGRINGRWRLVAFGP